MPPEPAEVLSGLRWIYKTCNSLNFPSRLGVSRGEAVLSDSGNGALPGGCLTGLTCTRRRELASTLLLVCRAMAIGKDDLCAYSLSSALITGLANASALAPREVVSSSARTVFTVISDVPKYVNHFVPSALASYVVAPYFKTLSSSTDPPKSADPPISEERSPHWRHSYSTENIAMKAWIFVL